MTLTQPTLPHPWDCFSGEPTLHPWLWRSLPLEGRSGSTIFDALFRSTSDRNIATLLESPHQRDGLTALPHARFSICAGAPRQTGDRLHCWTPTVGTILPTLQSLLERPKPESADAPPGLPFTGGWLGWLGYDLAWEIERLPTLNPDPLPFPTAYWYEPETFAVLDHETQILWLAASTPEQLDAMEQLLQAVHEPSLTPHFPAASMEPLHPQWGSTQQDYESMVRQAKAHIQAGDIFQANLSLRFAVPTNASSWAIYRALHQINPSPFASYWQTPWGALISCSPERLVQLQGNEAQTRPIAGTRSRGLTPEHDQQLEDELRSNEKERAEHIMLVDLERNDLGRVCEWGSVAVDELLTVERYSHVMHLVSNVKGTLQPSCTPTDLIRALFPGGTITGCPKVRCMEIIEALEPVRRSLFYGSCGYLDWRGNLDLNILIRTLLYVPNADLAQHEAASDGRPSGAIATVWGQIGAGIVADSVPTKEWQESLQKAKAQLFALTLAETLTF